MSVVFETNKVEDRSHDGYEGFLRAIRQHFSGNEGSLFTTNASNLWNIFLNHLPDEARQHYTCNNCRHFVERYGGLVCIAPNGHKYSAVWPDPDAVPEFFTPAIKAVVREVAAARVNGVFVSRLTVYGNPITGEWRHMAVQPHISQVWTSPLLTDSQKAAERRGEFKMLINGLREFPVKVVEQALKLLRSEALYRSEKVVGPAEWLYDLHQRRNGAKGAAAKENVVWLAVATAPAGFAHVRSTMIGTLLEDIANGMKYDDVAARFAAKMDPLRYLRPQAAPSSGNIAQAERLVEKAGIERSLERRFARADEIKSLWRPGIRVDDAAANSGGVFSHLVPKTRQPVVEDINTPPQTITWEKFRKTVLPDAIGLQYRVNNKRANYAALTTCVHDDAPPILQWDTAENRNPFSGYVYHNGSNPSDWNLSAGWCPVIAICLSPSMWQEGYSNQRKSVLFVLKGAKDTRYKRSGNAIFPETLKSDFHAIRSTIEAYSKRAELGGFGEDNLACGIRGEGDSWDIILKVTTRLGDVVYRLDRWD